MNQWLFKRIANTIFLALSCFLVTYFLIQLTDNLWIKIGIAVFAIGLDVFLQYVLALGRVYWRERHRVRAIILFICYTIYACIYAGPSAIGFFAVEIRAREVAVAQTEEADRINRDRLAQIDRTLAALNRQLETEAMTGYGSRSREIMARVDDLTRERAGLQRVFVTNSLGDVSYDIFGSLADIFKIPKNILKVLIFGVSVAMLYLGLILTSWDLRETNGVTSVTVRRSIPLYNHDAVSDVTEGVSKTMLCACGCGRPARLGSRYHEDKCRVRMYRRRKAEGR